MKRTTAFLVFALMMSVMAFAAPDVLQVETVEETAVEINIEESAELAADYGYCGDNLTWTLDDEGTLTISGSGEMYDYVDSFAEYKLLDGSAVVIPQNENDGIEGYEEWKLSDGSVVLMPIYENPDLYDDVQYMEIVLSDGSVAVIDTSKSYKELTLSDGSVVLVVDDGTEWVEYACSDGSVVLIDPKQTYAEFTLMDGSQCVLQNCVPWMQSKNEIKKIVVGKDVTILDPSVWLTGYMNLAQFSVDAENGNYKTLDNILYKGSFEHLLKCPCLNPTNKVVVPEGVKTIGDNAFYWTENVSEVIIPDSVTSIGVSAFEESAVEKVSFGENSALTSIESSAFSTCTCLTSIEIPLGVTDIGGFAFYNCNLLTSIEIPKSVTTIGECAFACAGLEAVYITDLAAWCGISFGGDDWLYVYPSSNPLYSAGNLYINGVLATDVSIPNGVTKISDFAFSGCTSLESIEIPESVRSIGKMAFYECENLESIEILGDVVSIGENAFECTAYFRNPDNYDDGVMYIGNSLIRVDSDSLSDALYKIKEGTTCVAPYAFAYCENLKVVDIPDSVVYIGDCAFASTGIVSVDIPAGVVSIGKGAFIECGDLVSVTFDKESRLEIIDDETFYYCVSLESIEIPESVTSIGNGAFCWCESLSSIDFGENSLLTSIGDEAFIWCTGLASIEIPAGVTRIGEWTFSGCTSLTDIEIPASVTSIGWSAFEYCESLTDIEIPESVTSIDDMAFRNCSSLEKVTIYGMDVTFGAAAFGFNNENITFYGYEGSTAETYASENNISFEIMLKPGDINGTGEPDGEDVLDLAVVIAFDGLENLSEKQRTAANLYTDDDGENGEPVINIKDLIKLVQMMAENR